MRTLKEICFINRERSRDWMRGQEWSTSDWGVAMAGEAGEVCDAIKKLNRLRDDLQGGSKNREERVKEIGKELADTFLYLDLLAENLGLDLEECIVDKFNEVSEKFQFDQRL